jgi:DNA-binding NarL/FixJ family response regulator
MILLPLLTGKLKLLVVDDSLIVSNRLRNLLSELEYIQFAGHAENFNDAVLFTDALKPHVLLLDINIKGKNGIDILKQVKKDYPSIKVIMFTNQSDAHYRKLCSELGADYFLDKSSEFNSLTGLLEEIYEKIKW